MRAVLLNKPEEITIIQKEIPVPQEGQALIRVKSVGICGSDIGAYRGANPLVSYPRIIGHEIAGEIVSMPAGFSDFAVGDHVIVDPYLYCGVCYPCSLGRTNCCEQLKVIGVHIDGGMTEYFAHPASMLQKVPDEIPWEQVPLAEPLTIALHALHRTKTKAEEFVLIFGAGPIGLLIAMSALAYQAIPIIADPIKQRLEKARSLGVEHTIQIGQETLETKLRKITGKGPQVVLEASGSNQAIQSALQVVSYAGRIAFTGWPKAPTLLPTDMITRKEVDILGARTSAGEFDEAVRLIATGQVDAEAVLSHVIDFNGIPETVRDISQHPEKYLKVNALI